MCEAGEQSVARHQLVEIAGLDEPPGVEHEDAVCVFQRAQAMGDDNPRCSQPFKRMGHHRLGPVVERACRLVEK